MEWGKFAEYGLVGLILAAIFVLIFKWSVWIMVWIREREAAWLKIVDKQNDTWNQHTTQAKSFQDVVTEAHRHQREEHKEQSDRDSEIALQLREITLALGRINGYKS